MNLVTKEGKLITIDFNDSTQITKYVLNKAKVSDLGLGDGATISYEKHGDKNILDSIEVKMKSKRGP